MPSASIHSYKLLLSFILRFMKLNRWRFFFIFLIPVIWSLDAILWPYLIRLVIDTLVKYDLMRSIAWESLKLPVFWGLFLWVSVEVGFRSQGWLLAQALPKLEGDIRSAMFDHIQRHSPHYFDEQLPGSLANKITDMTTHITQIIQHIITAFIPAIMGGVFAIYFFAYINPLFSIITALWMVTHFTICLFFTRQCDTYEKIYSEARTNLIGKIVDSFSNNFSINLFYRFFDEKIQIQKVQKDEIRKNYQSKRYAEILRVCLGIGVFLAGGVGINGFMLYSWMQGRLSAGQAIQIFNTTWNIIMIIWVSGSAIPLLFQSIGIAKQAFSVMSDPQDIVDSPHAKMLKVSSGEIVFDNISFSYGKKKLFENMSVHIRKGEKVGIVGYSGSGKSTFVKLILRFYQLNSGSISIDGQDISNVTLHSLRNQVTLIPQDPILFHRSLRENIHYGNPKASQAEVLEAARLAHCSDFIEKLPNQYETVVGDRGAKLSGGERQRIVFARALLATPPHRHFR